jgi:acetate---CoA ligase (ADP-forming)
VGSAGFAEGGAEGRRLQRSLVSAAHAYGVALCGPNNVGVLNVRDRTALWTAPIGGLLSAGPVALVSHSGSVAMALGHDLARLGISHIVSAGNEAVLDVADYVCWLADDDRIAVIVLFLETIRRPEMFAASCEKALSNGKEIVALKVGRSELARRAVAAHSAGIAGDQLIVAAYLADLGVKTVGDLDELVNCCEVIVRYQAQPHASGCAVITMSGGEAALAADIASDVGVSLPGLDTETVQRLRDHVPPFMTPANPLDSYGLGFGQARFRELVRAVAHQQGVGVVAVATDAPAGGGVDAPLARQMAAILGELAVETKTRFAMLNNTSGSGRDLDTDRVLSAAGIPFLLGIREGLAALASWASDLKIHRTPLTPREQSQLAELGRALIATGEAERFELLRDFGLPMVETIRALTSNDASKAARRLGFPVVMKGVGPHIAHKTERGLVHRNLPDDMSVRNAHTQITKLLANDSSCAGSEVVVQRSASGDVELIVGVRNDTPFGSIVVVGLGGIYTEVFSDSSVALGPINADTAKRMLDHTRVGSILLASRHQKPYDLMAVAETVALLSRLGAAARDTIASIEINPLLVGTGSRALAAVDLLIDRTGHPSEQGEIIE